MGSVWWEKLNKNLVPVQCMKLIFVPPWEGFSPNANRSSIMESVFSKDGDANSQVCNPDAILLTILILNKCCNACNIWILTTPMMTHAICQIQKYIC